MTSRHFGETCCGLFLRRIKSVRKAKGVTLAKLASETGIPLSTLARYLNGKSAIPLSVAVTVVHSLGLDAVLLTDDRR